MPVRPSSMTLSMMARAMRSSMCRVRVRRAPRRRVRGRRDEGRPAGPPAGRWSGRREVARARGSRRSRSARPSDHRSPGRAIARSASATRRGSVATAAGRGCGASPTGWTGRHGRSSRLESMPPVRGSAPFGRIRRRQPRARIRRHPVRSAAIVTGRGGRGTWLPVGAPRAPTPSRRAPRVARCDRRR